MVRFILVQDQHKCMNSINTVDVGFRMAVVAACVLAVVTVICGGA